jgi:hypothetical protein
MNGQTRIFGKCYGSGDPAIVVVRPSCAVGLEARQAFAA